MNRFAAVMLAAVLVMAPGAFAGGKPAPDGCHWQPIPELKGHVAVPDGWQFKKVGSSEALIYEVRPAGKGFERAKAIYRLEVRLRTKTEDVVARARAFVEDVRAKALEPPPLEEQQVSTLTLFSCFVRFAPASDGSPALTAAVSSAGNSRTGTIYTIRFDIPENEIDLIGPLGNGLFREMRMDDEI
jgi:hypothetical protein